MTRISNNDKLNSSGASVVNGYTSESVVAISRQDSANFYVFNKADYEGEYACKFSSKVARAQM